MAGLAALSAATLPGASAQEQQAADEEAQAQAEAAAEQARAAAAAQAREQAFAELLEQVNALRAEEAEMAREREAEAQAELEEQERLAREAVARRDRAEARSAELDMRWEANEDLIEETTALLRQHEGNLGELFGVTRQVAGDAAGTLEESLLSTQFEPPPGQEERAEFMRRIAGATALPSINELERVWYELLREMTASGKVVRYQTDVLDLQGNRSPRDVVRVGPFTAISDGGFLGYLPSETTLAELDGQLGANFRAIARQLEQTQADAGYTAAVVDPARGALLGLYLERPNVVQRIEEGEVVGYVIIAVGVIGALLALFQAAYLLRTRFAVRAQLRDLSVPRPDNPLGRVLLAFRGDGDRDRSPENLELAELRLSEAVLHEVPKLERFQSFLRLAVAAGPLLGLIGTVIGMIITFRAITASGSSDPKIMAHGIGQAMIATVLGLGIAIPLLFINAGLTAFSRSLTQILDEQSQALLAETMNSRNGNGNHRR
ncbi:MAG TPA: MotA/TolQ/ExbB proton channel family protein [Gammaproteobacteria bacterium]